jgi:hypothetical protein
MAAVTNQFLFICFFFGGAVRLLTFLFSVPCDGSGYPSFIGFFRKILIKI